MNSEAKDPADILLRMDGSHRLGPQVFLLRVTEASHKPWKHHQAQEVLSKNLILVLRDSPSGISLCSTVSRVPAVAQLEGTRLVAVRTRVQSLASLSCWCGPKK